MSSLRKVAKLEAAAYRKHQAAVQDVVVARLDGADEATIARLSRRAQGYRGQWQSLSTKLEVTENRAYA